MAEYIEREKAQDGLDNIDWYHVNDKGQLLPGGKSDIETYVPFKAVEEMLKSIPAADVRPVVRGKWSVQEIYKHEMSYGTTAYEPVYKCSACGNLMESYLRYDEPIMPEDADFPRFCPNCGADMREES